MRKESISRLALVVLVLVGTVVGVGAAQETSTPSATPTGGSSVSAEPPIPGEQATHVVIASAEGNQQIGLTGLTIDYGDADVDLSGVSNETVVAMGIDQGGDFAGARTNLRVIDDINSVSVDGNTVTIELAGNYAVSDRDQIVVVMEEVTNPSAGEHEIALDVNPEAEGGQTTAMLKLGAATTTVEETVTEGVSGTGGPGFTPVAAVLAVALVGLLALRRSNA